MRGKWRVGPTLLAASSGRRHLNRSPVGIYIHQALFIISFNILLSHLYLRLECNVSSTESWLARGLRSPPVRPFFPVSTLSKPRFPPSFLVACW